MGPSSISVSFPNGQRGLLMDPPRRMICSLLAGAEIRWIYCQTGPMTGSSSSASVFVSDCCTRWKPCRGNFPGSADPRRESANRVLVPAPLAEVTCVEARRAYQRYRDLVRRELGIEPSEQLVSLEQETVRLQRRAGAGNPETPGSGRDTTARSDHKVLYAERIVVLAGSVCCVAMLVLGIIGSGSEYRHKTIIPAMLIAPRRGALVAAKVIGIALAGVVLSGLTFGLGLATAVAELTAHHIHHLPADTGTLFAGSVIAGTLFGVIGVALGYITRSTIAAIIGAVGWVLFAELAILHTLAPHLARWLVTGAASTLTDPGVLASRALTPATAVAVLSAYAVLLVAVASRLVLRRDVA